VISTGVIFCWALRLQLIFGGIWLAPLWLHTRWLQPHLLDAGQGRGTASWVGNDRMLILIHHLGNYIALHL